MDAHTLYTAAKFADILDTNDSIKAEFLTRKGRASMDAYRLVLDQLLENLEEIQEYVRENYVADSTLRRVAEAFGYRPMKIRHKGEQFTVWVR